MTQLRLNSSHIINNVLLKVIKDWWCVRDVKLHDLGGQVTGACQKIIRFPNHWRKRLNVLLDACDMLLSSCNHIFWSCIPTNLSHKTIVIIVQWWASLTVTAALFSMKYGHHPTDTCPNAYGLISLELLEGKGLR